MIKKYDMIAFKEIRNFIIIIAILALVIYVASLLEPAAKTDVLANIADELIFFRDVGEVDDV